MKFPKIAWFLLLFAAAPAFSPNGAAAASEATNAPAPKIHFDNPIYDFGKATTGETIRHTFIVSNAGDAKLIISNVRGTCSCTTAGEWTREIDPGKTGEIPLQINSTYLRGAIHKMAIVTSNDKSQPNATLQLIGSLWTPIEVNPAVAYVHLVSGAASNPPTVLRISNKTGQPLTLSQPETSSKLFAAEIKTIEPGNLFELSVSAVPPLPSGNTSGTITIKTSATNMPVLSVTAVAMAPRPAIVATPEKIILPPAFGSAAGTHNVLIQSTVAQPLVLSNATVNAKGVDVRVKELQPGRQFYIILTFPAGFQASGDNLDLSVESNFPQFRVIKVPIVQMHSPVGVSAKKD